MRRDLLIMAALLGSICSDVVQLLGNTSAIDTSQGQYTDTRQRLRGVGVNDSILARVALFGLRASIGPRELSSDRYFLLPQLSPLDTEGLIERLATLPKPIRCVGFAHLGNLMVACWTHEQIGQDAILGSLHDDASMAMEHLRQDSHRLPGTMRIGVLGTNPLIVLSDLQLEQWFRDYDLQLATISIEDAPRGSERLDAVLRFSAPAGGFAQDIDPPE
jgi:hypothetical protein